jgi:hypothetical protein
MRILFKFIKLSVRMQTQTRERYVSAQTSLGKEGNVLSELAILIAFVSDSYRIRIVNVLFMRALANTEQVKSNLTKHWSQVWDQR